MANRRRRPAPEREREHALLEAILELAQVGIIVRDETGSLLASSDTVRRWHPTHADKDDPTAFAGRLTMLADDGRTPLAESDWPITHIANGADVRDAAYAIRLPDGSIRHRHINGRSLRAADGSLLGSVASIHDTTAERELERRLQVLAHGDPLTDLPGRAAILTALHERLSDPDRRTAVLFLDLDHFKLINDGYGHSAGDELLRAVASRLRAVVRVEDVVGRLGGDEFVLLTDALDGPGPVEQLARRLCEQIAQPVHAFGREISTTASVGIALQRGATDDVESLLRDADTAMYVAKEAGRDRWALFDEPLRKRVLDRLHGEATLRRAIQADRLRAVYQPIVRATDGRIRGYEALVRLQRDDGTLTANASFIPVAEESGLVTRLDAWMLDAATRQAGAWLLHDQRRRVCVNLSARSLATEGLPERIAGALARNRLPATMLALELTETALIAATQRNRDVLTELTGMGVQIGLDDFGTGYSSLTHLRSFPVSFVKIDRSFVAEIDENRQSATIVAAIIHLAHSLGHTVVAEGVETERQRLVLTDLGCDLLQGYHLGRPAEAALPPNPALRAPETPIG